MRNGFYWSPLKWSFYPLVWNFDNQINASQTIWVEPSLKTQVTTQNYHGKFSHPTKIHPYFLVGKKNPVLRMGGSLSPTARPKVFNSFSSYGGWKLPMMMLLGDFLLFGEVGVTCWRYPENQEEPGRGNRTCETYVDILGRIWMFPKIVGFPPKSSHFERVFHYFHHPFWGTTIFGKHPCRFLEGNQWKTDGRVS